MKFENDKGEPVEINFQNFQEIEPGGDMSNLVRVKFKDGREEWIKATNTAVLEATVEEQEVRWVIDLSVSPRLSFVRD